VAWWDGNNVYENIVSFQWLHAVDLGRETLTIKVRFRGGKKVQQKQVEKCGFGPFLHAFGSIAAAWFCPCPGEAELPFHMAPHVRQFFGPYSLCPTNQFFPLSFGKKEKIGEEGEAICF